MTIPTVREVLDALDKVVREFGADYQYPDSHRNSDQMCMYVYDGKPDCIAAQVFVRLGVSVSDLAQYEGSAAYTVFERVFGKYNGGGASVLTFAQSAQDGRATWGAARDVAYEVARERGWL